MDSEKRIHGLCVEKSVFLPSIIVIAFDSRLWNLTSVPLMITFKPYRSGQINSGAVSGQARAKGSKLGLEHRSNSGKLPG